MPDVPRMLRGAYAEFRLGCGDWATEPEDAG